MANARIARGLEDLKAAPVTSGVPGDNIDVFGARQLGFTVESDSDTLDGDNQRIAVVRNAKGLSATVEFGAVDLPAWAVMAGGTVETTGSSPNQIDSLEESSAAGANHVQLTGQAPGVDVEGSAYRVTLLDLIAVGGPDETLQVNTWNTPTMSFEGVPVNGILLVREQYQTAVDITEGSA